MGGLLHSLFVRFDGDVKPLQRKVDEANRTMGRFNDSVGRSGGVFSKLGGWAASAFSTVVRWAKRAVIGVAGVAAVIGGLTIKGGVTRLLGLENAAKKLDQFGLSGKQADKLMANLNDTVKGTAFSLDEGAAVMTGFVAAGLPLDEVNRRMKLVADTAAFSQQPLGEIGIIFEQIQAKGQAYAEEMQQLAERQVPVWQILSAGMGKSIGEVQEMMSNGEISAAEFFEAYAKGAKGFGDNNVSMEGSAKSMGDTTSGAWANMKAAAGRFGARILEGLFPSLKTALSDAGGWFDALGERVGPVFDRMWDTIGTFLTNFREGWEGGNTELDRFGNIVEENAPFAERLGDALKTIWTNAGLFFDALPTGNEEFDRFGRTIAVSEEPAARLAGALSDVWHWVGEKLPEAWQLIVDQWNASVAPAWEELRTAVRDNKEELGKLAAFIATVGVAALIAFVEAIAVVVEGAALLVGALGATVRAVEDFVAVFITQTGDFNNAWATSLQTWLDDTDDYKTEWQSGWGRSLEAWLVDTDDWKTEWQSEWGRSFEAWLVDTDDYKQRWATRWNNTLGQWLADTDDWKTEWQSGWAVSLRRWLADTDDWAQRWLRRLSGAYNDALTALKVWGFVLQLAWFKLTNTVSNVVSSWGRSFVSWWQGLPGRILTAMGDIAGRIKDKFSSLLKGFSIPIKLAFGLGDGLGVGALPGSSGGGLMGISPASVVGAAYSALGRPGSVISGFRPGARTLSGNLSYHAQGRALDITPNIAIAHAIRKAFGSRTVELITPWRQLDLHRGRSHYYSSAVHAQHSGSRAHIHWAMNRGGLLGAPVGPDRDTRLAAVTPGEYVMRRAAVNRLGVGLLDALNNFGVSAVERRADADTDRMRLGFQTGGLVTALVGDIPVLRLTFDKPIKRVWNAEWSAMVERWALAWDLGITSTRQRLEQLRKIMVRSLPWSDEWVAALRERQRIIDDLLSAELAKVAEAERARDDAHQHLVGLLRAEQDLLAARKSSLLGAYDISQRIAVQFGNSAKALIANTKAQTAAIAAQFAGLAKLRERGLSEDIIRVLNLEDLSAESAAQVRALQQATDSELQELGAVWSDRVRLVDDQVSAEHRAGLGQLGDDLREIGEEHGMSYAEALAAAMTSQVPAVASAAATLRDTIAAVGTAEKNLGAAQTLAQKEQAAGTTFSQHKAPLGRLYRTPSGDYLVRFSGPPATWARVSNRNVWKARQLWGPDGGHTNYPNDRPATHFSHGWLTDVLGPSWKTYYKTANVAAKAFRAGGIITKPSTFMAGEAGAERLTVQPLTADRPTPHERRMEQRSQRATDVLEAILEAVRESGEIRVDGRVLADAVSRRQAHARFGERVAAGTSGWKT